MFWLMVDDSNKAVSRLLHQCRGELVCSQFLPKSSSHRLGWSPLQVLWVLILQSSLPPSPTSRPLLSLLQPHWLLKHTQCAPASGTLHLLFLLSGVFPPKSTRLAPPLLSGVN